MRQLTQGLELLLQCVVAVGCSGQILATVLKTEPTEVLGRQAFRWVVRTQRYYCLRKKTAGQACLVSLCGTT